MELDARSKVFVAGAVMTAPAETGQWVEIRAVAWYSAGHRCHGDRAETISERDGLGSSSKQVSGMIIRIGNLIVKDDSPAKTHVPTGAGAKSEKQRNLSI